MTSQGVSSTQHISQAQANTALGAEGQHNPAPTGQQTEQVHHYNQADMNQSTKHGKQSGSVLCNSGQPSPGTPAKKAYSAN